MDYFAIGAPGWVVPASILGAVLLVIVAWAYLRAPASRWTRALAFALKIVALAAIVLCLLEPLQSGRRPRPRANIMALVVDNSQSMQVGDGLAAENRRERLISSIRQSSSWRTRLDQDFAVRTYGFDSRLFAADDYATLAFDGYASSLLEALDTIGLRFRSRPVAGLLLFSDGNATDLAGEARRWESLGFPVYPVVDEVASQPRDLAIAAVSVNQSDFEAAPVTLQVDASSTGFAEEKIVAQLQDEKGGVVEEQVLPAPPEGTPASVRFRFRPEESGVCFYRVAVCLQSQREAFERNESGPEVTRANNTQLVTIQGRRGPYRVLYVCGRPNWEFKFLRRALSEDDEVRLAALVRIARKQPKFAFRDRGVSGTNPLFENFSDEEDAAEQYHEPVMLKYAIEPGELQGGFPKTAEELFSYQAVVLDDIEADFFTQDQMLLLRRFVSSRGGGLLMLGGPDSFGNGGYDRTPLGELAPVYLSGSRDHDQARGAFRIALTREGLLEPWMRLRDTQSAEQRRLESMPEFRTLNQVGHFKAGAAVLAMTNSAAGADRPVFVVQRFGKGRSAALLVGDLWRWALHRQEKDEQDLPQAWRQMTRWLVSDVPRRVELKVEQSPDPAKPVEFRVSVRDPEFLPLDNATVELDVTSPEGNKFTLTAEPSAQDAGLYEAAYWPLEAGGYRVVAAVTAPDGTRLPSAEGGWSAEPAAAEYRALEPNHRLLEEIAERTGGEMVALDDLDAFVESLPNRHVPVTETWVYPVWHQPWVLALAVACLCAEWGLRRWRGLP
jgi:uncharacterized membrane protein